MKPMVISEDLAAVVGKGPMPRSEVVKALWVYIKKNNLQDPAKKNILANYMEEGGMNPNDIFGVTNDTPKMSSSPQSPTNGGGGAGGGVSSMQMMGGKSKATV
jgi:hypothetical protein